MNFATVHNVVWYYLMCYFKNVARVTSLITELQLALQNSFPFRNSNRTSLRFIYEYLQIYEKRSYRHIFNNTTNKTIVNKHFQPQTFGITFCQRKTSYIHSDFDTYSIFLVLTSAKLGFDHRLKTLHFKTWG